MTEKAIVDKNKAEELKIRLRQNGFYVQRGYFRELDTIKEASAGRLLSCFGNNAGSAYSIFDLPAAPNQLTSLGRPELGWRDEIAAEINEDGAEKFPPNPYFAPGGWEYKLRADEAIVLITLTPPQCKYYSFFNYIMFTEQKPGKDYSGEQRFFSVGNDKTGLYHPIFGSIGDSINIRNIKCTGESVFDKAVVIVIAANRSVTDMVKAQLIFSGYPEETINVMPLPEHTYKMGLQKGADTFSFLGRISQAEDPEAYRSYLDGLSENSVVYRVTPVEEKPSEPYGNPAVIPRGTGRHEAEALDDPILMLDRIRKAVISKYSDEYDYEELASEIAVPEGLTAYFNDTNALGDNRDAMYLMTRDFSFTSDDDFVLVYGVNHTAAGKALYSNAVLYARPMFNGVCSVYDKLFAGSADEYLGSCDSADKYYVYKIARKQLDKYTALVDYSTGNEKGRFYGVDNDMPVLMAFRAYLEDTGTGASYYEIVYDRTIVFHKK